MFNDHYMHSFYAAFPMKLSLTQQTNICDTIFRNN